MRFTPKTEEDISSSTTAEPGIYDFECIAADDKTSKSGNDMIEVLLKVFTPHGELLIFDYLLEKVAYKLRHFCDSTGLLTTYESGSLSAANCQGKSGKVKLGIRKEGQYAGKNEVKDYIKRENFTAPNAYFDKPLPTSPNIINDDIPF